MTHPIYDHCETDEIAANARVNLTDVYTFDHALEVTRKLMGENGSGQINDNIAEALLERARRGRRIPVARP